MMSSTFRIPKKKTQGAESENDRVVMQSPLSRLQDSTPAAANGVGVANGEKGVANATRVHAGNALTSRDATQRRPFDLRAYVRKQLKLDQPMRAGPAPAAAANQSRRDAAGQSSSSNGAADGRSGQGGGGQSGGTNAGTRHAATNGWRPKRASDRLLPTEDRKSTEERRVGSGEQAVADSPERTSNATTEEASMVEPFGWRASDWSLLPSPPVPLSSPPPPPPAPLSPSPSLAPRRRGGDGQLSLAAQRTQRDKRRLCRRWRPAGPAAAAEPIVLSSEEEDMDTPEAARRLQDAAGAEEKTSEGPRRVQEGVPPLVPEAELQSSQSSGGPSGGLSGGPSSGGPCGGPSSGGPSSSSVMELSFSRILLGGLSACSHGDMLITQEGINLPLKGPLSDSEDECLSVAVVTTQLRGYGVWEKGVATGGPAPLLFLWVTDSQAGLLQTELSVLQPITSREGACPFLLVELASPLAALQAALLRSLLDMCSTASVDVSHGLSLMHKHPHLLAVLGHCTTAGVSTRLRSRASTSCVRLIQYPLTPGTKGRIAVTTEDLSCLDEGEFLNDVIIDFYLKYLLLECSGTMSERCHIFSSFFYRQLTRRRTTEEEPQPLDRVGRHQRVKTWTRNVDIFDKDFLFVPVNQASHWFLVLVCFPGLIKERVEETTTHEEQEAKRPRLTRALRSRGEPSTSTHPECTRLGWKGETPLKRPCILVLDSLKRSCHESVCKLLRDYLCVEWSQRRQSSSSSSSTLFTSESMRSSNVRQLPLQDNSSDCGLYLLQYAETFLRNPVVNFDLPVCLHNWFPRQHVRRKRAELRQLVMDMHRRTLTSDPDAHP